MTRITWNDTGSRLYDHGIDRGVLYTKSGKVAAWNGLRSVEEKPFGAEVSTFYLDGEKFNQMVDREEFSATISAITYPNEFKECDGTADVGYGLNVTSQDRTMFDLTYRTKLGNDTDGPEHAYRLHFVFNALASPTTRKYDSDGDVITPLDFTWDITTMPITWPGQRPTAHLYLDSNKVNKYTLNKLEDILYGTASVKGRMLTLPELIKFFKTAVTVTVTNNGDGTWTAEGPDDIIQFISWYEFIINWDGASFIDEYSYNLKSG